jgi:hypothetical protein
MLWKGHVTDYSIVWSIKFAYITFLLHWRERAVFLARAINEGLFIHGALPSGYDVRLQSETTHPSHSNITRFGSCKTHHHDSSWDILHVPYDCV